MSFFSKFPVIAYPFETFRNGTQLRAVRDIVLNVRLIKDVIDGIQYFDEYDIPDGERIEMIAEKLYGDAQLHWVIMLINERYDYLNDFPLDEDSLEKYVDLKYGEGNRNAVHQIFGSPHYEDPDGNIVEEGGVLSIPITNYEYEFRLNESKRRIKILDPSLINQVVRELQDAFSETINEQQ
jgi:hypothetical protein